MRSLIYAISLSLLVLPAVSTGQSAKSLRVLFLGNSYTYYNDLHLLVRNLAKAAQPDLALEVRAITEGGISLGELWQKREVQEALDKDHWDYVVLQEHSMLGWSYREGEEVINDPAYFWQSLQLFALKIRRAGAIPVLFLTWARKAKPDTQPDLDYAYATPGRDLKARVAPVGRAWFSVRQQKPDLELFAPDGSHPSLAGSYLAACVMLNTILESKCESLPAPAGIEADDIPILQAAADGAAVEWRKIPVILAPKRTSPNTDPPNGGGTSPIPLQGVWKGRTWMYRQPAHIEVEIKVDGDQCSVIWTVSSDHNSSRSMRPSQSCMVEPGGLRFVVQDWFSSAVETHSVRLQGKDLIGRVQVGFRTAARSATGSWRARATR